MLSTRVLFEFGKDIAKIVRMVMDSNVGINYKVKPPTNTLTDSNIYKELVVMSTNDGDLIFDIVLNDYITYIEKGRRKGAINNGKKKMVKMPPVEPIVRWARSKGIPTDNNTIWAIRKAISRDGIKARPIMARVFDELKRNWNDGWSDHLFDKIMEHIDKFFA